MNQNLKKRTAIISLIVGLIMFAVKVGAYLITGSSAIFSDAAESVVHILATGMVLFSIIVSLRPPDENHLYGHGNIEFFSAGIEGLLIITAAVTIIYYAVSDIISGAQPKQLDIGVILIAFAGLINVALGLWIVKKGKQTNSIALIADGKHILTDAFTSIGVVIGLILVLFTNIYLIDPLVAIFVALNIVFTGYNLIRSSIGGLMMETDDKLLTKITSSLNSLKKSYMIDLHNLRFWTSSDKVFIDFHLTIPYYFNIKQSHEIEDEISALLEHSISNSDIRVHFDFCDSSLCKNCEVDNCEVRSEPLSESIKWTKQKLINKPINKNKLGNIYE